MATAGGAAVVPVDLGRSWLDRERLRTQLGGWGPSDQPGVALPAVAIGAFGGNGDHRHIEGRAAAPVLDQDRVAPLGGAEDNTLAAGNPQGRATGRDDAQGTGVVRPGQAIADGFGAVPIEEVGR